MTHEPAGTLALVGAGIGVGASVARRFARAGFAVGLIARNPEKLEEVAANLVRDTGAAVATATADAAVPDDLASALTSIAQRLGDPTALCFSPLPDITLIRPVLETSPAQFLRSLELNVAGAAAAVAAVVPAMRKAGSGSLLFTTGSAGLAPSAARAASAVTTTAATTYIALLREALAPEGIRVGHTIIAGPIAADRPDAHHPDDVAADLWRHHVGEALSFPTVLRLAGG